MPRRFRPANDSDGALPTMPALDLALQFLVLLIVLTGPLLSPEPEPAPEVARLVPIDLNRLPPMARRRLRHADMLMLVPGRAPMSALEAKSWLKDRLQEVRAGTVSKVIYFWPDSELTLDQLSLWVTFIKASGYTKVQFVKAADGKARLIRAQAGK